MGEVAKINQADLLEAYKARLIDRIPDLTTNNTHFDDDPNEFLKERPSTEFACIVTAAPGDYDDSFNVSTCHVKEKSHTIVGIYTNHGHRNDSKHIDHVLVEGEKSLIRYWKPAIMAAMLTQTDQNNVTVWMPQTGDGKDMLIEPMQIRRVQGPQRGPFWDLWMQIVFFTHFEWNLRSS